MEWLKDQTSTETLGLSVLIDELDCLTTAGAFRGEMNCGLTNLNSSKMDVFCVRYNQKGNIEWAVQMNTGYSPESPLILLIDEHNNYYIVYSDDQNVLTISYIKRFGQIMWTKTFIESDKSIKKYHATVDDTFYLVSTIDDQVETNQTINNKSVLFKLDINGNYIWSKGIDSTSSLVYEKEKTVIVVGVEESKLFVLTMTKQGYSEDIYYFPGDIKVNSVFDMKIDSNNGIIITTVTEDESKLLTLLFSSKCEGSTICSKNISEESDIISSQIFIDGCDMFEYVREEDGKSTVYKNDKIYLTFDDLPNRNYPSLSIGCEHIYIGGHYLSTLDIGNGEESIYKIYGREDQTAEYFVQMLKV